MGISRFIRTIIFGFVACVGCSFSLATTTCPLDHVVFVDPDSGRTFVSKRVALDLIYRCSHAGGLRTYHFPRHQARLENSPDCKGPFGQTIVQGQFGNKTAFAVYSTEDGTPCCSWNSFVPKDKAVAGKHFVWLTGVDVPRIALNDERYTIENNTLQDSMIGPLASGEYAPDQCRKEVIKLRKVSRKTTP